MKTRAIQLSDKALQPFIKFAAKNPWTYAAVADRMTHTSGETFYRQEVNAWLHPDPAKRTEPRLGAGLLLIKTCQPLIKKRKPAKGTKE